MDTKRIPSYKKDLNTLLADLAEIAADFEDVRDDAFETDTEEARADVRRIDAVITLLQQASDLFEA